MDINLIINDMFGEIMPILTISGWLAFAISVIVMLVNMVINAATGKGFNIGLK